MIPPILILPAIYLLQDAHVVHVHDLQSGARLSRCTATVAGFETECMPSGIVELPADRMTQDPYLELQAAGYVTTRVRATRKDVYLDRSSSIRGVARGGNGQPLPGIRVRLRDERGRATDFAVTGSSGAYQIDGLKPGLYVVEGQSQETHPEGHGVALLYPRAGDRPHSIRLEPGSTQDGVDLTLTSSGTRSTLRGEIALAGYPGEWDGRGAAVIAIPDGASEPVLSVFTNTGGGFELPDLPSGGYTVLAWGPVPESDMSRFPNSSLTWYGAQRIDHREMSDVRAVIPLRAPAAVEVSVVQAPASASCAGVPAIIRLKPEQQPWPEQWFPPVRLDRSRIERLPAGRYGVHATAEDLHCHLAAQAYNVETGATLALTLQQGELEIAVTGGDEPQRAVLIREGTANLDLSMSAEVAPGVTHRFRNLAPGWELQGCVTGDSGPLRNLYVTIGGPMNLPATKTDGRGCYRFRGDLPGQYSISVVKTGDIAEPGSRTVRILSGQKLEKIDFHLRAGGSIEGRVIDREGRQVRGFTVVAYSQAVQDGEVRIVPRGGARTSEDGKYHIPNLSEGTYLVAMTPFVASPLPVSTADGAKPPPKPFAYPPITFSPGTRDMAAARRIAVTSGQVHAGADLAIQREATYCVHFTAETGPAASGSRAFELRAMLNEWIGIDGPTVANSALSPGTPHRVCGLAAGDYRLHLIGFEKDPIEGRGYAGEAVAVPKRDVALGVVTLSPKATLRGSVLPKERGSLREHKWPDGMSLRLIRKDRPALPGEALYAKVAPDGTFALPGVYAGSYGWKLEGLAPGHLVQQATQDGRDVAGRAVQAGQSELRIELSTAGASVSGRVLDGKGTPQPDATVFLGRDGSPPLSAQSDQDGNYMFETGLAEGRYRIVALPGLPDAQRRDDSVALRALAEGVELRLEARDVKTVEVRTAQR